MIVSDDVYRAARIHAAERGSFVSALVSDFLRSLSEHDAEFARLERRQREVQARIGTFRATDRLSRAELQDRAVR